MADEVKKLSKMVWDLKRDRESLLKENSILNKFVNKLEKENIKYKNKLGLIHV